ncbi:MAG: DNA-directed RNA polymerase subunit beta' [Candidatus Cloacimonetes bacterium]|nr:DNA-directed RNA polymerase subunit beta' [Candidatus Cloacimonadota bacterium]MCF7814957.1 DNA-directed RNA polymerase subunit beta' [Candidatus Cloacimonadota bacterium]MCF7869231.1 DNA-directed RNA polymerase subunit beta' [Candidatus Cloacimonadota bacterium]MCF7884648.1 DNA-directed RNA polymerase subunit beta' [Candidatus Cloacimonadota bacterium]
MIREIKRDKRIENYDKVRIKIASPDAIREWSYGEVIKSDTLNYRTLKPEKGGLFCERIFGPEKDYECSCGKYKKKRFQNTVCDRCGVEITSSRVRRSRMGHIELAVPIAHIWFVKSMPSVIGTLLDMPVTKLERVLYYESFIVLNPGDSDYEIGDLVDVDEYYEIRDRVGEDFEALMGAEAVKVILEALNLEDEAMNLRTIIKMETSVQKKQKAIKRLKIVDAFRKSGNQPEWMVLEVLPVLPPTLRPLVQLEGGRFATADFNELYRRVITRNNRLRGLIDINAPEVILRNEKRMLQEAVDALIDNSRKSRPVKGRGNRPLKALADQLKGKSGRFRQNLLGKRVDYSGRSVITVGPSLKLHQCGLPKEMAIELFKPFIIERLEKMGEAEKAKTAKKLIEKQKPEIWKILEEVIQDYPVLLNRAPTLHKHGIQAFMPVLTEGKAIELHPLVCIPYNADFDGDQMAVHVPLSHEAQMEARILMLSTRNLLLPASGKLAMATNQDIVLGNYYLTVLKTEAPEEGVKLKHFSSTEELLLAYELGEAKALKKGNQDKLDLDIHSWINILIDGKIITTTVGRVIFNQILPKEIPFKNVTFTKGKLNDLAMECYEAVGQFRTAEFLDSIKELGFKYATKAGITFSASDVISPKDKDKIINKTEKEVQKIITSYLNGEITETERYNRVIDKWKITTDRVTDVLMNELHADQEGFNSINMMYISGARGGKDQIKQLGAMRGLMDKPSRNLSEGVAEVIETPIKSNFKQGLTVLEYFISTHGARKGLADTALKTADAGYLTRRLVDVAQNAVIVEENCGTIEGLELSALKEGLEVVESLSERIKGRTTAEDIIDPVTDKIIVEANSEITNEMADTIQNHGINTVKIRTVLTCDSEKGICARCYGRNLGTNKPVTIGEPVGVIAAQSIGEPGTQLTLRTFHIGGTASTDVDLAEVVANYDGIVKFEKMNTVVNRSDELVSISHLGRILILDEETKEELENYKVEYAATVYVRDGQKVVNNTKLFSWDHYNNPLIATAKGKLKFEHFIKDVTYKEEFNELTGSREITIIESKDRKLQAQFKIVDGDNEVLVPIPTGLSVEIANDVYVHPGDILGKSSRITVKQGDITGGLPRVQDLFEARVPKEKAILSEIKGIVSIGDLTKSGRVIYVRADDDTEKKYVIPPGKRIIVHQGDKVDNGDALSDGPLDPHDILKAKGIKSAQKLILEEIQEVYRKQGVKIDDKHIGVIIRQMFKKLKILNPGHTMFLEGEIVDRNQVMKENKRIEEEGGEGATFEQLLLGITKASLLTDSWLSAASFQETTKVLTQSSIEGRVDDLEGLKESIIIGHRIPIGTGTKFYNQTVKKAVDEGKSIGDIIKEMAHSEEEEDLEEILDF